MLCLAIRMVQQVSSCPVLSFSTCVLPLVAPSTHKAKAVHEKRLKGLDQSSDMVIFILSQKVWRMEKRGRGHKRGEAG